MRGSLIVGGGPGGTGPLIWAAQCGGLDAWLASGVAILERGRAMGGTLGRYIINSDSLGIVYLECLDPAPARELFAPMREADATRELDRMKLGFPPLKLVGQYLDRFGSLLEEIIARHPASAFLPQSDVRALHLRESGAVVAETVAQDGTTSFLEAHTAIVALGGRQDMAAYLRSQLLAGVRLADVDPEKVIPSDALLTAEGLARADAILRSASSRRVIILGGSHSAFSVGWVLTNLLPEAGFAEGDITILMRREPRIYYVAREDAERDRYPVSERDICPRTKRVNRLGGLRGDGRELWRRLAKRPGTEPEPRIAMVPLCEPAFTPASLRRALDEAALVIPAFGYRAGTLPIFDAEGRRLELMAEYGGPAVGRDARLLLADGGQVPNVFGIGLGTDYRPWGHMGGEPSFDGQANSLWLFQNDIGAVVYQGVRECIQEAERPVMKRRGTRVLSAFQGPKREPVELTWPVPLGKPAALG
jgi:hypothetical protein